MLSERPACVVMKGLLVRLAAICIGAATFTATTWILPIALYTPGEHPSGGGPLGPGEWLEIEDPVSPGEWIIVTGLVPSVRHAEAVE